MALGWKEGPRWDLGWCFWGAQPQVSPPCPHRVLAEAVVHFPQTLAEVTLGAGPGGKISLRNYVEDEAGEPCGAGGPLPQALGCCHNPLTHLLPPQRQARRW